MTNTSIVIIMRSNREISKLQNNKSLYRRIRALLYDNDVAFFWITALFLLDGFK